MSKRMKYALSGLVIIVGVFLFICLLVWLGIVLRGVVSVLVITLVGSLLAVVSACVVAWIIKGIQEGDWNWKLIVFEDEESNK